MNSICVDEARRILSDLISIPTVNPMGRPYAKSEPVERKAMDYLEGVFRPYRVEITRQACSPIHENLLIALPGRAKDGATLLESHVDTVQADEWLETAFRPRLEGQILYGRGACDDKGPLTSMILAVRDVLESGDVPPYPVAFLAAGDEEYAQTGIKYFAGLNYPLGRSVIGEPTSLTPILQHRGTVRWDITAHGRSAHTSRPELGCNAILDVFKAMAIIEEHQQYLNQNFMNPLTDAPCITVTMIQGGRTRNAVPDECTISVDYRVVPGMEPAEARQALIEKLGSNGINLSHGEAQLLTPALYTRAEHPFSQGVLRICRRVTGQPEMNFAGAPFGTDAVWVSHKAPAIVLGPGSIDSAHTVNEHVDIDEVVQCAFIYRDILMSEF
jgi:acetylornithine deacetylase/succinyl-diaminopimelate desuccinylase-like protein